MQIETLSREELQRQVPDPDTVVISLYHPADHALPLSGPWALAAAFAVQDDDTGFQPHHLDALYIMAEYAHRFAHRLIVQCDAGLSRSVGVAKAISAFYNGTYRHAMPGNARLQSQVLQHFLDKRDAHEAD